MAKKAKSKSAEKQSTNYKTSRRWESNRIRKLKRTLKAQPNNEQVKKALSGGVVYRRKTPAKREWSASWIRTAKIFKLFCGRFDRDIMSSNEVVAKAALSRPGPKSGAKVIPVTNNLFSLYARSV